MSTYTTTAPAGTRAQGGRRFGRKKKSSGPAALIKNEMRAPKMRMVEWRAKSGERWGVARAGIQEKFTRLGADMSLGFYTVTHPFHPIRRHAAKEAAKQKKLLASDVKQQKVAAAHSIAAAKRARAREARVATLNQAVH